MEIGRVAVRLWQIDLVGTQETDPESVIGPAMAIGPELGIDRTSVIAQVAIGLESLTDPARETGRAAAVAPPEGNMDQTFTELCTAVRAAQGQFDVTWLVLADWLEEQGDARCHALRGIAHPP